MPEFGESEEPVQEKVEVKVKVVKKDDLDGLDGQDAPDKDKDPVADDKEDPGKNIN